MSLDELDTPCLLVDSDRVERNLAVMAQSAASAGVALRPHATHRSAHIARRQVELGACGLACATVGEAEALVSGGIGDVFVLGPVVGAPAVSRLVELARAARLRVGADSVHAARPVAAAAEAAGVLVGVSVEIGHGAGYRGIPPAAVPDLARELRALPGLWFEGVFGYGAADAKHEAEVLGTVAGRLRRVDVDCPTVSLGSEGPAAPGHGITEIRPGDYALAGAAGDGIAATVATRVVGRPDYGIALVDAGLAALPGGGSVMGHPESRVRHLGEHHGVLAVEESLRELRVGDLVELVPEHAGHTVGRYNHATVVSGGEPAGTLRIDARWCAQ